MPNLYASTFISGMSDVVLSALRRACPDVQIIRSDDGMIFYETEASRDKVQQFRFFNNTFAVLTFAEPLPHEESLKHLVKAIREDEALEENIKQVLPKKGRYTVMASVENQPAAIPPFQKEKLEKCLSGISQLTQDRQKYDMELWLVVRREGYGFFGKRITGNEEYDQPLQKGELRPELAHLLCLCSEPCADDIFLDPCCGSGAIALERARAFPAREIAASDADPTQVEALSKRVKAQKLPINVGCFDALHLKHVADGHYTKIVTDPPWGLFAKESFDYEKFLKEMARILKKDGLMVLLLGRAIPLEELLKAQKGRWELRVKRDLLVSGQKATVWILRRI